MTIRILLATALGLAVATPVAAQSPQTGTGGGPSSTVTAPNTSAVGRTMPPAGGGLDRIDRSESRSIERETRTERRNDKIDTGICIGCDK